jgi:hypothetical protein
MSPIKYSFAFSPSGLPASRGKLFYRLIEQAAAIPSHPYRALRSPVAALPPQYGGA